MAKAADYEKKFQDLKGRTFFPFLDPENQELIQQLAGKYRFTFQEVRLVCDAALDLRMWNEQSLREWWKKEATAFPLVDRASKKQLLKRLESWMESLKRQAKSYSPKGFDKPEPYSLQLTTETSDRPVVGKCPVASEETVCCNLRTIDAVENCGFGCSYCAIQTFYGDKVVFDSELDKKLRNMELDSDRFYHLGTGQSSDSLMWGNQNGLLDTLCQFAAERPNVLLELKTKSKNVEYFLKRKTPRNIAVSWSLNTPNIIRNEEHFTAGADERLRAARRVADEGVKVAFHFHPLVYYRGWREEYTELAEEVQARFAPEEVLFVSLGVVTFIKPVVKAIRERGWTSKMLQMELTAAPKGKLSYPDTIKKEMFEAMYRAFSPWRGKVFMYLCMEKAELWRSTFGYTYESNEEFEADFGRQVFLKMGRGVLPEVLPE